MSHSFPINYIKIFILLLIFIIKCECKPPRMDPNDLRDLWSNNISKEGIMTPANCYKEVPTVTILRNPPYEVVGNGSAEFLSIIKVCCDGFEPYKFNNSICIPKCDDGCPNGFCSATNFCECKPQYVRSLSNDCVETCPISCLNGKCDAIGVCTCNEGYILNVLGHYCIPKCPNGCGAMGNCTEPDVCDCINGYRKNSAGQCVPYCENNCINGVCVEPGICSCHEGFILKDGVCQADCSEKCDNGICISPSECICNEGYIFDWITEMCIPNCQNCEMSTCIAPNVCECYENYHLIDGKCKPLCKKCFGRECVAPDVCICSRNHYMGVDGRCKRKSNENCVFRANGVCKIQII